MTTFPSQKKAVDDFHSILDKSAGGYLLTGPEGIGKTAIAEELAARLLHIRPGGEHPGLQRILPDETKATRTIGVDQVRALIEVMRHTATAGRKRVGLVLPADSMTPQAANALLKTLEEPPSEAVLLLVSHRPGSLPATIRSRCHFLPCPFPTQEEGIAHIMTTVSADETRARRALAIAGGRPGTGAKLLQDGVIDIYDAITKQMSSTNPFERSSLIDLGRAVGKDFAAGHQAVSAFLWRAAQAANGYTPEGMDGPERKAVEIIANGAVAAWPIVQKIAEDTVKGNLDARYAGYRMLLGIEHGSGQA